MLRVPTYLTQSQIHGVGVYTPERIKKGTVIWEFTPEIDWRLPPDLVDHFPEPYRATLRSYCYIERSGMLVLCGDNARFMNHSFEPNCDDSGLVFTVTRRDIEVGEELTCDYRLFDAESAETGLVDWLEVPPLQTKRAVNA